MLSYRLRLSGNDTCQVYKSQPSTHVLVTVITLLDVLIPDLLGLLATTCEPVHQASEMADEALPTVPSSKSSA